MNKQLVTCTNSIVSGQTAVTITFVAFEIFNCTANFISKILKSSDTDKTATRSLISFFSKVICLSSNPTHEYRSTLYQQQRQNEVNHSPTKYCAKIWIYLVVATYSVQLSDLLQVSGMLTFPAFKQEVIR